MPSFALTVISCRGHLIYLAVGVTSYEFVCDSWSFPTPDTTFIYDGSNLFPYDPGSSSSSNNGSSSNSQIASTNVSRLFIPLSSRNIICENEDNVKAAAAAAAFHDYKATVPRIRFLLSPNRKVYKFHFANGSQVFRWTNSIMSSFPLTKIPGHSCEQ